MSTNAWKIRIYVQRMRCVRTSSAHIRVTVCLVMSGTAWKRNASVREMW